jgi:lipopolysaccharide biosynthesis glycosyltransferase
VPDGAWVIYTGRLPQPLFGVRGDLPLDERFRPIFLSVHIDSPKSLPEAAIEYLRKHAPIGCRDWSTVLLLHAAGVPAFFSGAVTTTLDTFAAPTATRAGVLSIDARARGQASVTALSQDSNAVRRRDLAGNLRAALEHVDALATANEVRTTRLQSYLAARALGTSVSFQSANRSERRLWGLLDIDNAALASMQRGITDKLAAVYGAILAGKPEDEVYATWRSVCADDLERAEAFRADVAPLPAPIIDVAGACATIRAAMVTVERTQSAGDGDEINVEFSLDGNYKHQLEVVLDSIVANTTRPVRAFVLCRDHTQADYDRMAALFPEVSFVWLPTDSVEYGQVIILCGSVATLDRLLLPDLLPEVSRIVHHDLDALCLADLGELYDVDLHGTPLAAVMSPQKNHLSGFSALMSRSESFRNDPERAHEYLLRTHTRHRFDYNVLNAGIMTLDLDVMRADDFSNRFMPFVERFKLSDQALLNVYVGGNRVEVDPGWNWRPWLETMSNPKIAHWAGPQKPWKDSWVVGRDLWRAGEARLAARHQRLAG